MKLRLLGSKKYTGLIIVVILLTMLTACGSNSKTGEPEIPIRESDGVIVVGGGAAGLAAAIAAADTGSSVILVEKLPVVGGSALCSGGIVYGADTPTQARADVEDSAAAMLKEWQGFMGEYSDEELLRLLANASGETIAWLEGLGVEFAPPRPAGDSPVPRAHEPLEGGGGALVRPLELAAKERDIEILLETQGRKLLVDDEERVIGVEVLDKDGERLQIHGSSVVLATGGFGCSTGLKEQFTPEAAEQLTYSRRSNTGDGILMARELGAAVVETGSIIGFRGVEKNICVSHPVGCLVSLPSLYVNEQGKRFVDESADYPLFYEAMQDDGSDVFFLILDGKADEEILQRGIELGVAFSGKTIRDLAQAAGIPGEQLEETVEEYNAFARNGVDQEFGKDPQFLDPVDEPSFYALRVVPAALGTGGGLKINQRAQVLDEQGNPISGLYAAGEVASGQLFASYPASGTSLQLAFTFGRLAGREAAQQ